MASTNKTPLGLNHWVEDDKPRMEDFNADNQLLDTLISTNNAEISRKATKDGSLQHGLYAEKARHYEQIKVGVVDLNEIKDVGVYSIERYSANLPQSNLFFAVYVSRVNNDSNYVQQLAISVYADMYLRSSTNGVWGTWKKINFES